MFRPICPSSGVKIYLLGKLLLFVVAAVTYPLDAQQQQKAAFTHSWS
jgi:hypothetical protein